ncbi:hypothetical protein CFC21_016135 [Triticum aestivum]|uniref:Uncharacterized protein n=2 Tax=Triticum aestivum TaxID=4565 RepID=A0A3B6AVK6_WHEAT|nr:hypothetical protein CFC21_016135 [Triticum aestivum]
MASRNTALFLVGLLLSCVAMSNEARILEEDTTPSKSEEHLPELPDFQQPALPKVELPPFPEVHLPHKPELPKVELPPFPEVHLPPKPELPPKPDMPTILEFHFPEPEARDILRCIILPNITGSIKLIQRFDNGRR